MFSIFTPFFNCYMYSNIQLSKMQVKSLQKEQKDTKIRVRSVCSKVGLPCVTPCFY